MMDEQTREDIAIAITTGITTAIITFILTRVRRYITEKF